MNWHYLYVFFQSNGLEVIFLLFFYSWFQPKDQLSLWQILSRVTLCNSITHPLVLFVILKGPFSYLSAILMAETFAIVTEAILHRRYLGVSTGKASLGSLLANLISWQLGPILTTLIFLSDRV